MSRKRLTGIVVGLALLVLPAAASAITGLTPPKAGRWKIDAGGFVVSHDHKTVTGFHTNGVSCGLAKNVVVKGTVKLRTISEGGGSNWVVGYADPSRKSKYDAHGLVGQKVSVKSGTKTVIGRLDIVFAVGGFARDNGGDLIINGCDLSFFAHHV